MQNPIKILMGHLNVNSLRKKFPLINDLMKHKIDIQFLSEMKTDETFPSHLFENGGYGMSHKYRNKLDGRTMFYKNYNIPCRILNTENYLKCFKVILLEFFLRMKSDYVLVYINYLTKMGKFA